MSVSVNFTIVMQSLYIQGPSGHLAECAEPAGPPQGGGALPGSGVPSPHGQGHMWTPLKDLTSYLSYALPCFYLTVSCCDI
jgi:hypothetical protein